MKDKEIPICVYIDCPVSDESGKMSVPMAFSASFYNTDVEDFCSIENSIKNASTILIVRPTADLILTLTNYRTVPKDPSSSLNLVFYGKANNPIMKSLKKDLYDTFDNYHQFERYVLGFMRKHA